MVSFWEELAKKGPIIGLSPMDGVTDAPFRYMVAKYGRPSVIFTEFVSVDGLHYAAGEKREQILKAFDFDEAERPVVAQVFGHTTDFFVEAAKLVEELGFDGLDINMGCPAKKVSENGSGAGLIRTPKLAQEIVLAARAATKLPVSVKTRVGVESASEMEEWIEALMEVKPAVLSLHGRTLRQLYAGEADWEAIGRAARIVHRHGRLILGNGDARSVSEAKEKMSEYGVDGVLMGRAAQGNPAVFAGVDEPEPEMRLKWMGEHARLHEQAYGSGWFLPARKHLAWYAKGFPGASELRSQLVRTSSAAEVEKLLEDVKINE